jgi:hypothetical protein
MLILDKTQAGSYIYPTISFDIAYYGDGFLLEIVKKDTNKTYSTMLPENLSEHTDRCDKFLLHQIIYADWDAGDYKYTIWEFNGDSDSKVTQVEVG